METICPLTRARNRHRRQRGDVPQPLDPDRHIAPLGGSDPTGTTRAWALIPGWPEDDLPRRTRAKATTATRPTAIQIHARRLRAGRGGGCSGAFRARSLLPAERGQQPGSRGGEIVLRLDQLGLGGGQLYLRIGELDDGAHTGLVPALGQPELFLGVVHGVLRCDQRLLVAQQRGLGLLDIEADLELLAR
jgi:hypothetical protein